MRKKLQRQLEQHAELHFDIATVAFGRGLSHLSVTEELAPTETGAERKQLTLYRGVRTYGKTEDIVRKRRIAFRPMYDQRSLAYRLDATPDMLRVKTEFGEAYAVFDGTDILRIKGSGISLRFFIKMGPREGAVYRSDGCCQVNQLMTGEFLFVPVKGKLDFEAEWIWERRGESDVLIDIEPGADGEFEIVLHSAEHGAVKKTAYRPLEECREEARADYEKWYAMYPRVPGRFENLKQLCAYTVWICHVEPKGLMGAPAVLFSKPTASGMFSWHQAYHAMSITNDADASVEMMLNFFPSQDAFGELPDIHDDKYNNILATKPPFHGYSLLYMLDHMGGAVTEAHCRRMYEPLSKLYGFWTSLRDTDNDGVPQYNHGCESGIDNSDMFRKGVPAETPDIIAYIILLAEGLSKLAARIGMADAAAAWREKSDRLLEKLLTEFWNGKRFVARLSTTHEIVETLELEAYMPVMLGNRLPRHILDAMLDDLTDPEKYFTPFGFRSGPKTTLDGKPMPGFIGGFAQVKMLPALWYAGERELARSLIAGYCEKSAERVPGFGILEFKPEGMPDVNDFFNTPGGGLNSLAAAMFLCLAGFLEEIAVKPAAAPHEATGGNPNDFIN
ncbi:MAG: hypothetical protein LBS62_03065 [Clostridiales bacterium]|nr:hypothetical protein [Clostridiales bacterium]